MNADDLSRREAAFWDRQEQRIGELYARPHDWRFVPFLADRIAGPRLAFLKKILLGHRGEIESILDIGCGSGWLCHACAALGFRTIGIDLSPNKVAAAARAAEEQGVAARCRFVAGDVLEVSLERPVDLLAACGSLHHLPGLADLLPRLVEKHLRRGGLMLFSEPHHEGMPPYLRRWIVGLATGRRFRSWFDWELYRQAAGEDVRGESPAGLEQPGGHVDMRAVFRGSGHELLAERFFDLLAGHMANAFHVYMKPRAGGRACPVRLPGFRRRDGCLWRGRRVGKYAADGVWGLRRR